MTAIDVIQREPRDFQRAIPEDQLLEICRRTLGSRPKIESVQELSGGMFNNTFLVKHRGEPDVVLRVGPHPDVYVFSNETLLLRREYDVSSAFTSLGELIPETIAVDFSHTHINRDVMFQSFIDGELWDEVKHELTPVEDAHLWQELGHISAKIHAIAGNYFGQPDPMSSFATWSESILEIANGMWQDLKVLSLDDSGVADYVELVEMGSTFLNEITTPQLIHGDLWPKNVLIDRSASPPKITGLLDAERAMWGDPAAEWIYYFLDIPDSYWISNGRFPTTPAARFRHYAYQGLYDIQIFLEAWRFNYSDEPFRTRLTEACKQMASHLPT